MVVQGQCRLPPLTYYRPSDPKSSFRIAANEYIYHLRDVGIQVEERDLDFSAASLGLRSPATPLAIVHPLFLFRNWHGLAFQDVVDGLQRRHSVLLGMEVADSNAISPRFAHWANHPAVNGIMLPSQYSCRAFRDSGVVTPLCRVPHGVMTVAPSSRFAYLRQDCRPLVLFFATRDEHRKGWDLLRAIIPAFPSCLFVIKSGREGRSYFRQQANTLILDEWLSPADLASLYYHSDLLVSLHRGGAFEMHCMEALGYGLPVVATRHGCVLDYLNEDNAWLVDVGSLDKVYPPGDDHCGLGATADVADARDQLGRLLAEYEAAKQRARNALPTVRENWSWHGATRRLIRFAGKAIRRRALKAEAGLLPSAELQPESW